RARQGGLRDAVARRRARRGAGRRTGPDADRRPDDRRHVLGVGGGQADRRRHAVSLITTRRPEPAARRRVPSRRRPGPSVWRAGHPRRRLLVLFVACALLLVAVVVRGGMLQTVDQQRLAAEGEAQRLSNVTLTAPRGALFDR